MRWLRVPLELWARSAPGRRLREAIGRDRVLGSAGSEDGLRVLFFRVFFCVAENSFHSFGLRFLFFPLCFVLVIRVV